MSTVIEVVVDAPAFGILPQRVPIDLIQIRDLAGVLTLIENSLYTTEGDSAECVLIGPRNLLVLEQPDEDEPMRPDGAPPTKGSYVPLTSLMMQLVSLARLRIVPATNTEQIPIESEAEAEDPPMFDTSATPVVDTVKVTASTASVAVPSSSTVGDEVDGDGDRTPASPPCSPQTQRSTSREGGFDSTSQNASFPSGNCASPPPTPAVRASEANALPPPMGGEEEAAASRGTDDVIDLTLSVMLDVITSVVADASSKCPPGSLELDARKLELLRQHISEKRAASTELPSLSSAICKQFENAILQGHRIGIICRDHQGSGEATRPPNQSSTAADASVSVADAVRIAALEQSLATLQCERDSYAQRLHDSKKQIEVLESMFQKQQQELLDVLQKDSSSKACAATVDSALVSPLRSPSAAGGCRAPPCTPAGPSHTSGVDQGDAVTNVSELVLSPSKASADAAEQAKQHANDDTQPPTPTQATASQTAAIETAETSTAVALSCMASPLLMVTVFYNEFDYFTKVTKKKGRTLTLRVPTSGAAAGGDSLFEQLRAAVAETFREGLDIGVVRPDGTHYLVRDDKSLAEYLSRLQSDCGIGQAVGSAQNLRTIRPVFQCFSQDELEATQERFAVGSSPKRLFVRSPVPPSSSLNLLIGNHGANADAAAAAAVERPQSAPLMPLTPVKRTYTRPLSARPISAMTATATPVSSPFDYIAGSLLDDDAMANEFRVVSQGRLEAMREDVLAYLEARYDHIGQPKRFVTLLNTLFHRDRKSYNANEFAIILLRLSQS